MGCCGSNNVKDDNSPYIKQKLLVEHPLIPKDIHKKINKQIEEHLCKINLFKEQSNGSGFFCKIPYPDEFHLLPALITNNHIINEQYLSSENDIDISINNISKKINDLKIRKTYTNENYDITIIEIFPDKDNIHDFLEVDETILKIEDETKLKKMNIYIIHYPNESCSVSYGILSNIYEYNIEHKCSTDYGSSGSPILSLKTLKVIGIHKGRKMKGEMNLGTLIKYPILELNNAKEIKYQDNKNEIKLTLKVNAKDTYRNIPILCSKDIFNKDLYNFYNAKRISELVGEDEHILEEINKDNIKILINDEPSEFFTSKKFKEGTYNIRLIFHKPITNCKYMFYGCYLIVDIDLSSFDTSNTTNMKGMFYSCANLDRINLSSLDTKNVTDMSLMFQECKHLNSLDLSSFDVNKVNDMTQMFCCCYNLQNIKFSSFNTKNVNNMKKMFYSCCKLTELDLSSFVTSNVTNMNQMFTDCSKLTEIKFTPSFNTEKVQDISKMFSRCNELIKLDLSSFNTSNITDMSEMF